MSKSDPIFIIGFTRGGTNILLNLLLSHPKICTVRGELQELFLGKHISAWFERKVRRWKYHQIKQREDYDPFTPRRSKPITGLSKSTKHYLQKIIRNEPIKARSVAQNLYITRTTQYSEKQIRAARPLCKLVDGNAFLVRELSNIFPGAHFIALVRNRKPVLEGKIRRGQKLENAASQHNTILQRLEADSNEISTYKLITFEELVEEPAALANHLYNWIGLDPDVQEFRLQIKGRTDTHGNYVKPNIDRQLSWYKPHELKDALDPNVDRGQMLQLSQDQISQIDSIISTDFDLKLPRWVSSKYINKKVI